MEIKHCPECGSEMVDTEICENCAYVEAKRKVSEPFFSAKRIAWLAAALTVFVFIRWLNSPSESPPVLERRTEFAQTSYPDSGQSHVIGRWCDEMIPGMPQMNSVLTIFQTSNGLYSMRAEFGDGSTANFRLVKESDGFYKKAGSAFGDKFRILTPSGNLQLLDKDGPIRTAKRLAYSPKIGEC